jgi:two-component system NarL family sensor kinase
MSLDLFWISLMIDNIITGSSNIEEMILLMSGFIILFFVCQQRRDRYQLEVKKICEEKHHKLILAAIANEETVRTRLSANLHDVGTVLSTVKLYLNMIQPSHLADRNKMNTLKDCKELIDDTVQTTRDLSVSLQPNTIKDFGLTGTMQNFCNKLDRTTGVQTSISVQEEMDRFEMERELAAFRIVEELTDNIVKHARAKNVNFSMVRKANNKLQIFIDHDGDGLSNDEFNEKLYSNQGLGLKNICNRLKVLNGKIYFEKSDNLMNTISVQIPITDKP